MKFHINFAIFALALASSEADACSTILSWDTGANFIVPTGPFTTGVVYRSTTAGGGVQWEEGGNGVSVPGMQVIIDGDPAASPESCIMSGGPDKQCNDPFQSSKRAKVYTNDLSTPIDLVFTVDPLTCPADDVYRFFLKYINLSSSCIESFRLELGTGTGDGFVLDPNGDLTFVDDSPRLGAFFAFGLFGDATTDPRHDTNGYYDPTARAFFATAFSGSNTVVADSLTANYAGLYGGAVGSWIPKAAAPWGFFLDDFDDDTENPLVGDWDGSQWVTRLECTSPIFGELLAASLVDPMECTVGGTPPLALSEATVQKWRDSPRLYVDKVEDFGNVNVNTHLSVSNSFAGDSFTLRLRPTAAGSCDAPWLDNFEDGPNGSMMGDPHIKTWAGDWYSYQGECDLVFLHAPYFHWIDGKAVPLDVHVRTRGRYDYSYIESAVVKVGDDRLEVGSFGDYFLNGVQGADLPGTLAGSLKVNHTQVDKHKHVFRIDLGFGEDVVLSTYKDIVAIQLDNAEESRFRGSVGLMGEFGGNRRLLGRDGVTVFENNPDALGQEWQVRPDDEGMLFQTVRAPQFPQKCSVPEDRKVTSRRLGEGSSVSQEVAQKACAHLRGAHKEDCVHDVMATGDKDIAQIF